MADWTDLLPQPGKGSGIPEFLLKAQNDAAQRANDQAQATLYQAQTSKLADQAAQERQYQADAADFTRAPTPDAMFRIATKYPDKFAALSGGWKIKDDDARRADVGHLSNVYSALQNKNVPLAIKSLEARRAADAAAGLNVTEDDYFLEALKAGGPDLDSVINTIKASSLAHIAAAVGLDKFSQTYGTVAKANAGTTITPGSIRLDENNQPVIAAPWAPKVFTMRDGDSTNAYEYDPGSPLDPRGTGGGGTGRPPTPSALTVTGLKPLFSAQESGGSYTARNKETGALGRWQIMPDTGKALARRLGMEWRPDRMLHDTPEDRQYQDKIGEAAIAEAIEKSGGNPATAFGYYYSGTTDQSKWGPKTKRYIVDMMKRFRGGPTDDAAAAADGTGRVRLLVAGKPRTGYRMMTQEEVAKVPKLDQNRAWQISGDGKISPLGPAPKSDTPKSTGNVIAPILAKVAAGKPLAPGEQQALDLYRARGKSSAATYREGQTATGSNGQKIVYRGGKWQPLK